MAGISSKAVDAAVGASGNLECLEAELANAASPGPDVIVNAAQLGLQCLGSFLKGAGTALTLAVLGAVTSFFSTFTGMVNQLISFFTGVNTFDVTLQRTLATAGQSPSPSATPPTQSPPASVPTQPPPTAHGPEPFSVTSSSPASGPASGGTLIVIHGTGFSAVNNVVMNAAPYEPPLPIGSPNYDLQNLHPAFTVVSDTEIDVTTTAGAAAFTYQIDFFTPTDAYFTNTWPGIPLFTYN